MDITDTLLVWYKNVARDLPWRQTCDPYHIWISEVILQQTRVKQGWSYYERFVARFPHVSSLASATEEEVLKLWQGLGYYSRARNLYAGARQIKQQFGGSLPLSYKELLKIKGIGPYTAAAIASIVGKEAVPVLDGNTLRVYSRLFGIKDAIDKASGRTQCRRIGEELIHRADPGTFNQAVMELGALICLPRKPKCGECPVREHCRAFAEKIQHQLPMKENNLKIKVMSIFYWVLLSRLKEGYGVFLKQRTQGIWSHLYDFPESILDITQQDSVSPTNLDKQLIIAGGQWIFRTSIVLRHELTHRVIQATFHVFSADEIQWTEIPEDWVWAQLNENHLPAYPVPRLIEKFLKKEDFVRLLME